MQIVEMDDNEDEEENSDEEEEEGTDGEDPMEEEDSEEEDSEPRDINEAHCRGAHLVSLYISTFLTTVRREWGNVDKHRVDKFYTAVRFMVSEAYKYMSKRHWNIGIIRLFNDVLYAEGLASDTPDLTNGLRYHLIDICVDELAKVNAEAELPLTEATFLDCLEPFFGLAQQAEDKLVQKRVMDKVLLKFLNEYSFVSAVALASVEEGEIDEEDKALLFNQVHVGTVSKFVFEIASDENTDERYRKSLYEMHKTFVRQIRLAGRDVDLDAEDSEDCCEAGTCGESATCPKSENGMSEDKENYDAEDEDAPPMEEEDVPAVEEEAPVVEEEQESKESKKKKRKKKKSKNAEKEIAGDVAAEEKPEIPKADEDEDMTTPKKKSSKKKRKKRESEAKPEDDEPAADADLKTPTPKSKKKKQKTASPPSVDPRSMQSPDQVISPSSSDDDGAQSSGMESSASKRVSFGKMNHCKSYKASMKAMKTLDKDRWDTASRTPDKSILRAKQEADGSEAKSTSKKSKKSSEKKKSGKGKPPLGPGSKKKKGKKGSDTTSHVERY
jgi:hypothetical protein